MLALTTYPDPQELVNGFRFFRTFHDYEHMPPPDHPPNGDFFTSESCEPEGGLRSGRLLGGLRVGSSASGR